MPSGWRALPELNYPWEVSMNYVCNYISGGGIIYDGGIWEKKETLKLIIFKQIKESFYQPNWIYLKIHKDETKNKRHCYRDNEDGTYTIYPDQCGTPHIFEPIEI